MRINIIAGNIYHVLNRGVDKRAIFLDDGDRLRFIHDLFEFNNIEPLSNLGYSFKNNNSIVIARRYIDRKPRKLLVEILAFVLMPNHYHLMLRPLFDDGVARFMKKLNMGYARYFNEKYQRSGALFQGRYKSIAINDEAHFIHLPYYIHLNPLDLITPEWRERELKDYKKAIEFLNSYRWSSHLDYLGKKNFPSLTSREFLLQFFDGSKEYQKSVERWLKSIDLENIKDIALE
ncbi:MAG: transposase [Patescibacteria group bacterium]